MTYPIHPGPSFPATKSGELPNTLSLAGQRCLMHTSHCGSKIAAAATWIHEGTSLIYGFLTRNPSWILIRCIQHASHRHNFMSPQNWLCRSERNPALDTLVPISPLVHINGYNAYSPQIPDTKLTVTSKVQFLQLQHVFRQNAKITIPRTSDDTRCHLNFS